MALTVKLTFQINGLELEFTTLLHGCRPKLDSKHHQAFFYMIHMSKQFEDSIGNKSIQCSSKLFSQTRGTSGNLDEVFNAAIKIGLIKRGIIAEDKCCTLL